MIINLSDLTNCGPNHLAFRAGDVIFHEGGAGDELYVIAEGSVELLDNERPVGLAGPGEVVGGMALVDRSPRTVTAVAQTACHLVSIDQRQFNVLRRHSPSLAGHLLQLIGGRLRPLRST